MNFQVHALCGDTFFDDLVGHANVKEAWERWQQGAALRENFTWRRFPHAGIMFENYRGTDDGTSVTIEATKAHFFPVGVPGLFITAFAPADTIDTVNTLGLLRVTPVLGRDLLPQDEIIGAPSVAVIGHRFWQDRFAGARDVIGTAVRLDGRATEIVGIMPEGFEFPFNQQVWRPLPARDLAMERGSGPSLLAFGRLSDGVSIASAHSA